MDELIRSTQVEFLPCAHYDESLDELRVELRDCSITEMEVHPHLAVLLDNHPEPGQSSFAGFILKNAKCIAEQHNVSPEGLVVLAQLFDKTVKEMPKELR